MTHPQPSRLFEPAERVRQAFLHFEFSIKLMGYFEDRRVDQDAFDCSTLVKLDDGEIRYPRGSFNSYDDLILAAQNVFSAMLGVCCIALETACQDAGIPNNRTDLSPKGQLRSMVYQMRCAFAHDAMHPRWAAKPPYARRYEWEISGKRYQLDLAKLNGQALELEDIGGPRGFLAIRDEVLRWIEPGVQSVSKRPGDSATFR